MGDPALIARSLNQLLYPNMRLRRWQTAIAYGQEAQRYYISTGEQIMESESLRQIGWSQIFCGQARSALDALWAAHRISIKLENRWGEADCAFKLAQALVEVGEYGAALRLTQQGVVVAREIKHPHLLLLNLLAQGTVQRMLLRLDEAQATHLHIVQQHGDVIARIFPDWALAELCAISAQLGDWAAAHDYARRTLAARDPALLPIVLTSWCEVEALLRGGDEALARGEVERLGQLIADNPRYQIPYQRALAVLAHWQGDLGQALRHLEAAATLAAQLTLPGEAWPILAALTALHTSLGDAQQAAQYHQQAALLVDTLAKTIEDEQMRARFVADASRQSAR